MTLAALHPLADRAALYAALRRAQLQALRDGLGEHRWDVDLTAGTLTFSSLADPAQAVVARTDLIATVSPAAGSILWGWAHPQGAANGAAERLRARGAAEHLPVLTTPEVPFPAEATGRAAEWASDAAFVIGLAAIDAAGRGPAFVAPVDVAPVNGGTQAVFLLDVPGLAPLSVEAAFAALPRVLSTVPLRDGRTAAWGLARIAGWRFEWTDASFTSARVDDGTTAARFAFDETARIVGFGLLP